MNINEKNKLFNDVYARRYKYVVGYCKNSTSDGEAVAQEVFINFYNGLDKFRGQSSPDTYLYRCMKNYCCNYYRDKSVRKRKGIMVTLNDIDVKSFITPAAELISNQAIEAISSCIKEMDPKFANCINEYMLSGDRQLCATTLGIKVNTFSSRLTRARAILKKEMTTRDFYKNN